VNNILTTDTGPTGLNVPLEGDNLGNANPTDHDVRPPVSDGNHVGDSNAVEEVD
jgi:hypothetical protein